MDARSTGWNWHSILLVACFGILRVDLLFFLLFPLCSDSRGGGGGDFLAGFILGGAIFGTLAYVFAPQVISYFLILNLSKVWHV